MAFTTRKGVKPATSTSPATAAPPPEVNPERLYRIEPGVTYTVRPLLITTTGLVRGELQECRLDDPMPPGRSPSPPATRIIGRWLLP